MQHASCLHLHGCILLSSLQPGSLLVCFNFCRRSWERISPSKSFKRVQRANELVPLRLKNVAKKKRLGLKYSDMSTNRARLSWRVRLPFLQRRWLPVRPGMQVMKKAGWCPCECKSLLHKIHIKLHYIICMRVFIYIYVYMYVYT